MIPVVLQLNPDSVTGPLYNIAEISAFDDDADPANTAPVDVDSTPDGEDANDPGESILDDLVDDDIDSTDGDEDDHDSDLG